MFNVYFLNSWIKRFVRSATAEADGRFFRTQKKVNYLYEKPNAGRLLRVAVIRRL